ncbi:uncharacterized protein LOC119727212 [Patiria miniata]|uniref:IgGFc-binding protein N-terminal domain-containing protein n=1 Tax=Patiria miniata TaxID=46514 RepID=A0A913ZTB8_PATMI|nr:uncharacterized protein LOC119727212 [Patiria miniata]
MAPRWGLFLMLWFAGCSTGEGAVESGCSEGVSSDSKGQEFIFAIPSPVGTGGGIYPFVIVTSESAGMTLVNVSQPAGTIRHSVGVGYRESVVLNLTTDALARGSGFVDSAVVVTASSDVSVRCLVEQHAVRFHSDGFTAIPTDALGRDYFVLTFDTHPTVVGGNADERYHSQFVVTATRDQSLISVELSATASFDGLQRRAGEPVEFVLDRAGSAQIRSNHDLTGTKITSNYPVAVVAGNDCSDVLRLFNYCVYLVAQMPPVETWGRRFVLAHWGPTGCIHTWRILAPYHNTTLTFHDNHLTRVTPGIPRWYDYQMHDKKAVLLTADQVVLVVQYIASRKSSTSVLSIPIEQYTDETTYMRISQSRGAVQTKAGLAGTVTMSSPLAIIYPCEGESDILINGLELRSLPPSSTGLQDATGRYCVLERWEPVLGYDRWSVDSRRTGTRFSSVVLKFDGGAIVSAYPAAMLLESQGCAPSVGGDDVETTTGRTPTTAGVNNHGGILIALCSTLSVVVMLLVSCYATSFARYVYLIEFGCSFLVGYFWISKFTVRHFCSRKRCRGKNSTGQVRMRYNVRTGAIEGSRRQAVDSIYSSLPNIPPPAGLASMAPPTSGGAVRSGTAQSALMECHGEEPGIRPYGARMHEHRLYNRGTNQIEPQADRAPHAYAITTGEGVKHTYMAL